MIISSGHFSPDFIFQLKNYHVDEECYGLVSFFFLFVIHKEKVVDETARSRGANLKSVAIQCICYSCSVFQILHKLFVSLS